MKIKCIVVDDSALQRITITKLVKESPHLELVDDFANALEAKTHLSISAIDLIFLDIEMPLISGFDLLDGLKIKPQIIIITSKPDYAVKAFDYEAIDFLQKPISRDRFNKAVKKVVEMQQYKKGALAENLTESIIIKSNLQKFKILTTEIKWIEAFGDYIKVITDSKNYMVLTSMKAFGEELPKYKFIRVHKSYIINTSRIDNFNSKFVDISGTRIPVSRHKKELIPEALSKI